MAQKSSIISFFLLISASKLRFAIKYICYFRISNAVLNEYLFTLFFVYKLLKINVFLSATPANWIDACMILIIKIEVAILKNCFLGWKINLTKRIICFTLVKNKLNSVSEGITDLTVLKLGRAYFRVQWVGYYRGTGNMF